MSTDSLPELTADQNAEICTIWDEFDSNGRSVFDPKGNPYSNINELREKAIPDIQEIVTHFLEDRLNIHEFKTKLDSYNKRNNHWGFTAMKGQMFFNQLIKYNDQSLEFLTSLLKEVISKPKDLTSALDKIAKLESFVRKQYNQASNKKRVPNPAAVGYFLSYFWQIFDYKQWPIMYTSQIEAFEAIGIWKYRTNQRDNYEAFYQVNEKVKAILTSHANESIDNWLAEHAFWHYYGNPNQTVKTSKRNSQTSNIQTKPGSVIATTSAAETDLVQENVPPKFTRLVEAGNQKDDTPASKGAAFEDLVGKTFEFLGFEVEKLGQGKGRAPDLIIKHLPEVTAFLVDTKAYTEGYSFGVDDRAIKEYIDDYSPKLQKKGFQKIGFIIVSNSFKTSINESFINSLTWDTAIKRFILLTSEALLYLTAYNVKSSLTVEDIIESLVHSGNQIQAEDILSKFEDY